MNVADGKPVLFWIVVLVYLLVVAGVIPALAVRSMRRHADPTPDPADRLDPVEIGLMHSNGRAILTAVVELLRQEVITLDGDTLRPVGGGYPTGRMFLVPQVAGVVAHASETSPTGLARETTATVYAGRNSLGDRGYLRSVWKGTDRFVMVLLALFLVGPAVMVLLGPKPIPGVLISLVAAGPFLMVFGLTAVHLVTESQLRRRSRPTPAGRRVVAALLRDNDHLHPRNRPAWRTYGTAAALFGAAAVVDLYPDLVRFEGDLPKSAAAGSSASGGSGTGAVGGPG